MFELVWTQEAAETYRKLEHRAKASLENRKKVKRTKSSRAEGLFKQVVKTLQFLQGNPRHPSLRTHAYTALPHPYSKDEKVFEAYVQHSTPGAYRLFWCYGPRKNQITIIAITPHP